MNIEETLKNKLETLKINYNYRIDNLLEDIYNFLISQTEGYDDIKKLINDYSHDIDNGWLIYDTDIIEWFNKYYNEILYYLHMNDINFKNSIFKLSLTVHKIHAMLVKEFE